VASRLGNPERQVKQPAAEQVAEVLAAVQAVHVPAD